MKLKQLLLLAAYCIGTICLSSIYLFDYTESILFHSFLFVLVILINRLSHQFYRHREQITRYLYLTEFCFVIYLACTLLYGSDNFTQYKLLILPAFALSIIQVFGFKKQVNMN